MEETPGRRITVTSFFNEISDVNGFSSTSDISSWSREKRIFHEILEFIVSFGKS